MGFCGKMANRSYQYAVRSVYDIFKEEKPKVNTCPKERVEQKDRIKKNIECGCDKNGVAYAGHAFAIYQGKEFQIISHTKKMVVLSDGKRRRMENVEFKHAYEIENWWEKEARNAK